LFFLLLLLHTIRSNNNNDSLIQNALLDRPPRGGATTSNTPMPTIFARSTFPSVGARAAAGRSLAKSLITILVLLLVV